METNLENNEDVGLAGEQKEIYKAKILIIDDHIDFNIALRRYFSRLGYRVETSYCGWEGVFMAYTHKPDIIICDIILPDIDGYEAIRSIKDAVVDKCIYMIAISGDDNEFLAKKAGFNKFFLKPMKIQELYRVIEEAGF